eukprot:GEZU01003201.1.p1 GENE.GEZU01003201.1~~GEZU01003201.1.p1  ORF type:complete len:107 (-),score=16.44 GEZU01003201.1:308-628(-)
MLSQFLWRVTTVGSVYWILFSSESEKRAALGAPLYAYEHFTKAQEHSRMLEKAKQHGDRECYGDEPTRALFTRPHPLRVTLDSDPYRGIFAIPLNTKSNHNRESKD